MIFKVVNEIEKTDGAAINKGAKKIKNMSILTFQVHQIRRIILQEVYVYKKQCKEREMYTFKLHLVIV